MDDLGIALVIGLAALAGMIGGSARPDDRLSDAPRVFMRSPAYFLFWAAGTGVAYIVAKAVLG
jgi:hypothetical protein